MGEQRRKKAEDRRETRGIRRKKSEKSERERARERLNPST